MVPGPLQGVLGVHPPELEHERYRDIATADTVPVEAREDYGREYRRDEPRRDELSREAVMREPRHVERRGRSIWPWVLLGLAALFGLGWLLTRALPTARAPRIPVPSETQVEQTAMSMRELPGYLAGTDNAPRRFVLGGMGFEQGGSALTADGLMVADALAAQLKAHPNSRVRIEGYTEAGNTADMERLSKARADAVKDRLVAKGIDAGRIDTAGMGAQRPLASNENPVGRAQNRRIEIVVNKG
jgi:outer membrane protein OmpA-like peptidoglycan-associated protein